MKTKHYIIALTFLCLASVPKAGAQPADEIPVIPPDSLTNALYHSFSTKLDSARIFTQTGEYQQAVRMYATSFDELKRYSEQRRKHDSRYLAEHYETEQKEQRIAFLNETLPLKQRQNFLLILLTIITIITLTLLFVFQKYRLRSIHQRAARGENETHLMELESEQRQLEARLQIMETEKYQKELLAESLLINHKNKVLDDLRLFFVQNPELGNYRTELETILCTNPTQNEAMVFNTTVDEIHPIFHERLQQHAGNRLTTLDLEYCRMIFMKMTSKEMAEILQVDPNTIRTGKYRLKQKLGLDKEEDLGRFIEQLA